MSVPFVVAPPRPPRCLPTASSSSMNIMQGALFRISKQTRTRDARRQQTFPQIQNRHIKMEPRFTCYASAKSCPYQDCPSRELPCIQLISKISWESSKFTTSFNSSFTSWVQPRRWRSPSLCYHHCQLIARMWKLASATLHFQHKPNE